MKADIFFSPTAAALSASTRAASGCQVYETVNKGPDQPSTKLMQIYWEQKTAQNVITIGGPCKENVPARGYSYG